MMDTLAMAEQLKGEYRDAFEKIDVYGRLNAIDDDMYEDRILNVYDILTQAQNEERPVKKIIGRDIEWFCRQYFKVEDKEYRVKQCASKLAIVMGVILLYCLMSYWLGGGLEESFIETRINMFPVIIGLVAGVIVIVSGVLVNKTLLFKKNGITPMVYYLAGLIFLVVTIVCGVMFFGDVRIKLPLYVVLLISSCYLALYCVVVVISKYRKNM